MRMREVMRAIKAGRPCQGSDGQHRAAWAWLGGNYRRALGWMVYDRRRTAAYKGQQIRAMLWRFLETLLLGREPSQQLPPPGAPRA